MHPDAILRFFRQRLGWLLCLALLLPMAQAATAAHAVTHGSETGRPAGDAKAHLQHCPICTAAAVLGGNVLPGTPAHLVLAPAAGAVPLAMPADSAAATRPHLPPSRGPPRSFA
jgi:hypothetical protein